MFSVLIQSVMLFIGFTNTAKDFIFPIQSGQKVDKKSAHQPRF